MSRAWWDISRSRRSLWMTASRDDNWGGVPRVGFSHPKHGGTTEKRRGDEWGERGRESEYKTRQADDRTLITPGIAELSPGLIQLYLSYVLFNFLFIFRSLFIWPSATTEISFQKDLTRFSTQSPRHTALPQHNLEHRPTTVRSMKKHRTYMRQIIS